MMFVLPHATILVASPAQSQIYNYPDIISARYVRHPLSPLPAIAP
jgi:hypothetical protein